MILREYCHRLGIDRYSDIIGSVRLWRLDPSDTTKDYPFVCDAVIRTGHRGNIFNAQLLPHSARMCVRTVHSCLPPLV